MNGTLQRREFLIGAVALRTISAWAASDGGESIPFLDSPKFDPQRPRLPWDQTTEWITPKDHFFFVGHYGYPDVDPKTCRLEVKGCVEGPRTFTLDDLKNRPKKETFATLECSGNPAAGGLIG